MQVRYEGRADLSNNLQSDGSRFRDLGLVQITGRANYMMCGELLEKPQHAACQHYGSGLPEDSTLWSTRTSSTAPLQLVVTECSHHLNHRVVHGAHRAQLDTAYAQRIIGITGDGDQGLVALQACQAYV